VYVAFLEGAGSPRDKRERGSDAVEQHTGQVAFVEKDLGRGSWTRVRVGRMGTCGRHDGREREGKRGFHGQLGGDGLTHKERRTRRRFREGNLT
jgi:hypothetical protein